MIIDEEEGEHAKARGNTNHSVLARYEAISTHYEPICKA